MATILDTSLIDFLLPIFVFLFIFVVIYALLSKTELFGKNVPALNFLAAICVAAVAVFAGNLIKLVSSITPWIVFIIIVLVLIFGMFRFLDVKDKQIWDTFGGPIVVTVIILIVILIGLTTVFESQLTPFGGSSESATISGVPGKTVKNEVISTLTHPRLLVLLCLHHIL
ncbi:hypothetical protein HYU23_03560 [Candidatus Woesearchaeota archaeon]|nr:hypothetical protein [Candidatus Woesearchaeota archaeon]